MSISAFEHPFLSGLLGDEEMAGCFSVQSDLPAMIKFEVELARACAANGIISKNECLEIEVRLSKFDADYSALNRATAKDGVVVPELLRQIRLGLSPQSAKALHFGATSQDVIDTSLMLRLRSVLELLEKRLVALDEQLDKLKLRFGARRIMGYTRMQAAIPISVTDRITSWQMPIVRYQEQLRELLKSGLPLQFGGAVGTLDKFGKGSLQVRADLANALGLNDAHQWHNQRSVIVDIAHIFAKISGTLGKIGQDISLMAQQGGEISLSSGGVSSAMAHKQNPVSAEVLISQARFTSTQMSAIYGAMLHEQERSGSAWTLEWILLPQIAVSCGASTLCAIDLLRHVDSIGCD